MRLSRDPDRWVPDAETWDLPSRMNLEDCHAETTDRGREPARLDEENDR